MNQQQQNRRLRRDRVGPEPSSTSLLFSVQAEKAVGYCANVQAHLSLYCSHMR